jgi:hypothetical protein
MFENWSKNTGKGSAPAGEHHIREINKFYGNVKQSLYRPGVAQRVPGS